MDWIIKYSAAVVPLALLLAGAMGYFLRRQISGQAHVEDQESLERTLRLKQLMQAEGMTVAEVKQLRDEFRAAKGGITKAEAEAIVAKQAEAEQREAGDDWQPGDKVPFEHTTAGMRLKADEELTTLDAQLDYAIADFEHECTPSRQAALAKSQDAWKAYRRAEGEVAGLLWEGGTGAPLLAAGRMIELTEQRIKDIRLAQAEARL